MKWVIESILNGSPACLQLWHRFRIRFAFVVAMVITLESDRMVLLEGAHKSQPAPPGLFFVVLPGRLARLRPTGWRSPNCF